MSVKIMSAVWERSHAKGNQLLVLLAIADHCRDDGTGAYPSVDALARKCRLSPRAVQDNLRELAKLSELVIDFQAGPKGTNVYHVVTPAESAPPADPRRKSAPESLGTVRSNSGEESAPLKTWEEQGCPHGALHCNRVTSFCDRCARERRELVA